MPRRHNRQDHEMREVTITRRYTKHAEGSVLIACGDTRVLCNASVEEQVPHFLRNKKQGWVTAEYAMLPRATNSRTRRDSMRGRPGGRSLEIQRLIGRSLRAAINTAQLGERTITIDCDVIQADGGTRTAAITGAYVALCDAVNWMLKRKMIKASPLQCAVASVSVGICAGRVITDLDYAEDSRADTDMNIVMNDAGNLIEIQGTAEGDAFPRAQLLEMLDQAESAIQTLFVKQREALLE